MVVEFPDLVAPAVAGFGLVAMVLLVAGAFRPYLVLPLGLAGAVAVVIPARRLAPADDRLGPPLTALSIAGAFWVVSTVWSGQYLDSNLDPGTYANAGLWLTKHPNLKFVPPIDVFGAGFGPGQAAAPGWSVVHGHLIAQGNHGLPAFLAVGGWLGGPNLLLRTNALLGAAALIALFAFSRRFVDGWWSVLPVAIAAASQPFTAFARTTYTEPLAATLVLGGLALLVPAVRKRAPLGLAVAGFVVGAACLARVDCYLGAVAVVIAGAAAAIGRPERRWSLLFAPAVGWAIPALVGTADLLVLSRVYFNDLRGEIREELALGALLFVVAAGTVEWFARRGPSASDHPAARRRGGIAAGAGVVVAAALLASRPLWLVQHGRNNIAFGGLQKLLGEKFQPTRSYGEHSVSWLAWYFGWPTIAIGTIGVALLVATIIWSRRLEWAGPIALVLVDAALFLVKPSITPYQIWATRRFVPIVIPGLLVGAAFALAALYVRSRFFAIVSIALAVVALVIPVVVTAPVFTVRDHTPGLEQAQTLCRTVGPNAAVLLLDGPANVLSRSLAAMCGSATAFVKRPVDAAMLAGVNGAAAAHNRKLFVIATQPQEIPYARAGAPPPTTGFPFTAWQEEIVRAPHRAKHWQPGYWVGRVGADGRVEALLPGS